MPLAHSPDGGKHPIPRLLSTDRANCSPFIGPTIGDIMVTVMSPRALSFDFGGERDFGVPSFLHFSQ